MDEPRVVLEQCGRTWAVIGYAPGGGRELLEGGFFARAWAERARREWEPGWTAQHRQPAQTEDNV